MILISGPVIANLGQRSRVWANDHLRRGSFGPVIERAGILYASLPGVERHFGYALHPDQIAHAAAGKTAGILTITTELTNEQA
jgi:hypothetical protein